jgi:peptidoglycan hydrolase-like amidase
VPLGLEEKPSAVEQIQTATVVGHSTKRQQRKVVNSVNIKHHQPGLKEYYYPNGINARALAATL